MGYREGVCALMHLKSVQPHGVCFFLLLFFVFCCIAELASTIFFPEKIIFDDSLDFGDPLCDTDGICDGSNSVTPESASAVDDLQFSCDFFCLPARWSACGDGISSGTMMFGLPASDCSCEAYVVPKGLYRMRSPSGCFLFFLNGYSSRGWNSKYICFDCLAFDPLSFRGAFMISCKRRVRKTAA